MKIEKKCQFDDSIKGSGRQCMLIELTVHSSSFHVPGRISTGQAVQYKYRQYGTEHQMNDPLLMKFMLTENVVLR